MKKFKSLTALALAVSFASATITPQVAEPLTTVQAASKISLNKKSATIKVGKSVQLKVKGTKKKVKWSSSNSKIAKVSAKGKVTGKKKGTVKITAKVSKKKLTCKVKVQSAAKATKKPVATPTIAPAFPNLPTQPETNTPAFPNKPETQEPNDRPSFPETPVETNTPVEPEATSTTRPTRVPSKPATSGKPETTAPVFTNTPSREEGKQVSLALDFYLDAYDPENPDHQFVNVNFVNHLNENVVVETEAYVTTRGEDYPALLLGKPEGETVTIEPTYEGDIYGQQLTYDSWDYVTNGSDCTMWWLPLDENSTITFFFRVGDQRYKATINYDQKGALYREASDYEQLVPFTSAAPTTTPEETVTPSKTEKPVITETPVTTKEPTKAPVTTPKVTKEPVALDLEFYLEPYDPTSPDEQFVYVHFVNHLNQDVLVEAEAYVTTRGTDYPALILGNLQGETEIINPTRAEDTYGTRLTYDSLEYVEYILGKRDHCDMDWLPLDENSTITFFFRVGNQRYKATINFDQKGGLYYKADDTEQLEGFPYEGNSDTTTTE